MDVLLLVERVFVLPLGILVLQLFESLLFFDQGCLLSRHFSLESLDLGLGPALEVRFSQIPVVLVQLPSVVSLHFRLLFENVCPVVDWSLVLLLQLRDGDFSPLGFVAIIKSASFGRLSPDFVGGVVVGWVVVLDSVEVSLGFLDHMSPRSMVVFELLLLGLVGRSEGVVGQVFGRNRRRLVDASGRRLGLPAGSVVICRGTSLLRSSLVIDLVELGGGRHLSSEVSASASLILFEWPIRINGLSIYFVSEVISVGTSKSLLGGSPVFVGGED